MDCTPIKCRRHPRAGRKEVSDIADKIYAATGLTLGAEAAAAIGRLIQVENEKLRAAVQDLAKHIWRGDWDKLKPETRELLGEQK